MKTAEVGVAAPAKVDLDPELKGNKFFQLREQISEKELVAHITDAPTIGNPLNDRPDVLDLDLEKDEVYQEEMAVYEKEVQKLAENAKMIQGMEKLVSLWKQVAEYEDYLKSTQAKLIKWVAEDELRNEGVKKGKMWLGLQFDKKREGTKRADHHKPHGGEDSGQSDKVKAWLKETHQHDDIIDEHAHSEPGDLSRQTQLLKAAQAKAKALADKNQKQGDHHTGMSKLK